MKTIKAIIILTLVSIFTTTTYAAEVPRESAPCNATNEAIVVVESFIGDILTEVQNGLGYADARAKSNRIFFNAWLDGQTNGYSYGELVDIARNHQVRLAGCVSIVLQFLPENHGFDLTAGLLGEFRELLLRHRQNAACTARAIVDGVGPVLERTLHRLNGKPHITLR